MNITKHEEKEVYEEIEEIKRAVKEFKLVKT